MEVSQLSQTFRKQQKAYLAKMRQTTEPGLGSDPFEKQGLHPFLFISLPTFSFPPLPYFSISFPSPSLRLSSPCSHPWLLGPGKPSQGGWNWSDEEEEEGGGAMSADQVIRGGSYAL
jgi:hypothetical protein